MHAGEMQDLIEILSLENNGSVFEWATTAAIWGKAEKLGGNTIFSSLGRSAKSVKFTIRQFEYDLTQHSAIKWNNQHCIITDIDNTKDREYSVVLAALINPMRCMVERTGEPTLNELNRPVYPNPVMISFPGYLTEKYLGHVQKEPMATLDIQYILVTPKVVELLSGEIVKVGGVSYTVRVPHTLDDYKNEYEIETGVDA